MFEAKLEDALRKAFRAAYRREVNSYLPVLPKDATEEQLEQYQLALEKVPPVRRYQVVFQALVGAMHILGRLPDKEKRWLNRGRAMWPDIPLTENERANLYWEILTLIQGGHEEEDERLFPDGRVNASDVSQMEAVFETFRHLLVSRDKGKDWKILCRSARGESVRYIAKALGIAKSTIHWRRLTQCGAIGAKLKHLIPEMVVE